MSENNSFNKSFFLLGLVILLVLPELNNVHYDPQPQFWAEITVAWAILGLFVFTLFYINTISIPLITLPLAMLAIYLCLQQYIIPIDYPGLNYVAALELFTCILVAIAINTFKNTYGIKFVVSRISYALVIGAILQSLIGFIQYTGSTNYFGSMIFYDSSHPTTNIFGHFGQRNHYAHYLSWGSFALIYLFQQRRISAKIFYPLLMWLSFSLTISASRSVFIYFGFALVISAVYFIRKRDLQSKRLLQIIFVASIALFAFEYFYPLIHKLFTTHNNFSSGLGRLDNESGTGRRGVEWDKAWITFKEYPIFGIGWNEYTKNGVKLHHLFPHAALNSGLFTNCHNLVLQLLAETGLIGTSIALGGIGLGVYRLLKQNHGVESIILLCMISTTLAHSMNEYPLWYMYFLSGLIMFLSMDKPWVKISSKSTIAVSILPICGLVYLIIKSSIIFDTMVNYYDTPDDQKSFNAQAKYLQNLVDHNLLWSYHAAYTLDNYINVDTDFTDALYPLKTQYEYTHKFDSFHPYPDTLIKEAMLDWNLGNKADAERLVKLAVLTFPVYNSNFRDTLQDKRYRQLYNLVPKINK